MLKSNATKTKFSSYHYNEATDDYQCKPRALKMQLILLIIIFP